MEVLNWLIDIDDPKDNWKLCLFLNKIILGKTENILKGKGNHYTVKSGKIDIDNYKMSSCYPNAIKLMQKRYRYIEGVVTVKNTGEQFAHAWKADDAGNHFDFTFPNSEYYDYFGIELSKNEIHKVGRKNGTWFAALPFLENL